MIPSNAKPGLIVQCTAVDSWHQMMGKSGVLYRLERATTGFDGGVCWWASAWGRDTRRRKISGAIDGFAAGFSGHILEPIGDGADYAPHPGPPPGYAGEPLPIASGAITAT